MGRGLFGIGSEELSTLYSYSAAEGRRSRENWECLNETREADGAKYTIETRLLSGKKIQVRGVVERDGASLELEGTFQNIGGYRAYHIGVVPGERAQRGSTDYVKVERACRAIGYGMRHSSGRSYLIDNGYRLPFSEHGLREILFTTENDHLAFGSNGIGSESFVGRVGRILDAEPARAEGREGRRPNLSLRPA